MKAVYPLIKEATLRGSFQEAGQLPGTQRDKVLYISAHAGALPTHASMSDEIAAVNTMVQAFTIHRKKKSPTQDASKASSTAT